MIQRMAEATTGWVVAIDPDGFRVQHGCVVFGKLHTSRHEAFLALKDTRARAALEEMKNTTRAMDVAGFDAMVKTEDVGEAYQAMIDAALHETKDAVGREGE